MSALGMFVHGFMRTDVAAHISLKFWILGNVRYLSYICDDYITSIEPEPFLPF